MSETKATYTTGQIATGTVVPATCGHCGRALAGTTFQGQDNRMYCSGFCALQARPARIGRVTT